MMFVTDKEASSAMTPAELALLELVATMQWKRLVKDGDPDAARVRDAIEKVFGGVTE